MSRRDPHYHRDMVIFNSLIVLGFLALTIVTVVHLVNSFSWWHLVGVLASTAVLAASAYGWLETYQQTR